MTITLIPPPSSPDFWSGYSVAPLAVKNDDDNSMPYEIQGPKKKWGLMRNKPKPQLLFPVPEEFTSGPLSIKGVKWFKESIAPDGQVTLTPSG